MTPRVWVNGRIAESIAIDAHDAGFQRGHGVFETLGSHGGELPLWEHHLRRLAHGAARLAIPCAAPAGLRAAARELLRANRHDVLRITLTAGVKAPTWCLTTRQRPPSEAVLLHVATLARASDPLATIKHTSRAFYELALEQARAAGAGDALLLDPSGRVLETTTANLLFLADGEWRTPRLNGAFLPGIARALLLDALAAKGRAARELDVSLDDLRAADEIFVTNAVHGPRPAAILGGGPPPADNPLAEDWRAITGAS